VVWKAAPDPTRTWALFWFTPAGRLKELFDALHDLTDIDEARCACPRCKGRPRALEVAEPDGAPHRGKGGPTFGWGREGQAMKRFWD
jgi:hypothetical protein